MKKFATLMLALSFMATTVAVAFGQESTQKTEKKGKKGKKGKKSTDEQK